jgi:3-methyladenine DNA glycosylase/8-oxoguanine DNA glycosylase
VGVVCLQGLGRFERGLARDLGLVKLASALWGRAVEPEETDALLAPYGEWAGLASVYLLAGYHAGLVGLGHADRDPRRRQDRRVAGRRAA